MTLKERMGLIETAVGDLNKEIKQLQIQIINHSGVHKWDKIISYAQMTLLIIVVLMLKFKIM